MSVGHTGCKCTFTWNGSKWTTTGNCDGHEGYSPDPPGSPPGEGDSHSQETDCTMMGGGGPPGGFVEDEGDE